MYSFNECEMHLKEVSVLLWNMYAKFYDNLKIFSMTFNRQNCWRCVKIIA